MVPPSGSQIDKLGRRLRDEPQATEADLVLLAEVLAQHAHALEHAAEQLRSVGLYPTTRLKTSSTIIDKLRREPRLTLRGIDDLAGARIAFEMTRTEQDAVVAEVLDLWPTAKVVDRRAKPMYGYRAVHVVPRVRGCRVEIQVRTHLQDQWAQAMEALGDVWGRGVRYGEGPEQPDLPTMRTFGTRGGFTRELIALADTIDDLEKVDTLSTQAPPDVERTSVEGLKVQFRNILETVVEIIKTGRLDP